MPRPRWLQTRTARPRPAAHDTSDTRLADPHHNIVRRTQPGARLVLDRELDNPDYLDQKCQLEPGGVIDLLPR